jgi:uncharacterized protein YraI
MYVVYNIDHIHHLLNEPKKSKFAYNSDRREYCIGDDVIVFEFIQHTSERQNKLFYIYFFDRVLLLN